MRKIPAGLYTFQVGIYASSVDAYKNGGLTRLDKNPLLSIHTVAGLQQILILASQEILTQQQNNVHNRRIFWFDGQCQFTVRQLQTRLAERIKNNQITEPGIYTYDARSYATAKEAENYGGLVAFSKDARFSVDDRHSLQAIISIIEAIPRHIGIHSQDFPVAIWHDGNAFIETSVLQARLAELPE